MTTFKPRTATIPLYQGDYQQRVEDARAAAASMKARVAAAEKIEANRTRTLSEGLASAELDEEYDRLAQAHDDIKAEAEAQGAVLVTMQALGRRQWSALVEKHPPRTEESVPEEVRKSDADLGVNDLTLGEALVPLSVKEISDSDLKVDDLLEAISSAQFDLLYGTAFALNRAVGSNPKAQPRLLPFPSSDETGS